MILSWFTALLAFAFPLVVRDPAGAAVPSASVTISTATGTGVWVGTTGPDGSVELPDLPRGAYVVDVQGEGFESVKRSLVWPLSGTQPKEFQLEMGRVASQVTVTASRGSVEDTAASAQMVSVTSSDDLAGKPTPTLGNALRDMPGVLVQQSTSAQVSPFLRGLTGYQVLNLVDGVRFNNSTFRFGPNQYLALLEPANTKAMEVVLGPSSALYGSDAMGGTINVITPSPEVGGISDFSWHGRVSTFLSSGDASAGGQGQIDIGTLRHALLINGTHRRHNAIRAGNGADSHNVFARYFGLDSALISDMLGPRQQETNFSQSGTGAKWRSRLGEHGGLTLWHEFSRQSGVRGYKDLLGGRGQLQASFEPQDLHFFYTRYEHHELGPFDTFEGTFSVNAQRDGFARQGLSYLDTITTDATKVVSLGYATQATAHLGTDHALVFGGEFYSEQIQSNRSDFNPRTGVMALRRPPYPDDSRYKTFGAFFQSTSRLLDDRLRVIAGGRWTRVGFRTFKDDFGTIDSTQAFHDATFNVALTWSVSSSLGFNFLAGRGFRAPNLNDLGAIGINDLGFEIPSSEAEQAGALMGDSSGEGALSTGTKVGTLKSERLLNLEAGMRIDVNRFHGRIHVFRGKYSDPISRRTLLFPVDLVPETLNDLAVSPIQQTPAQMSQGVTTVATTLDPRAVKSFVNTGQQLYYGLDHEMHIMLSDKWAAEASYSYIVGRELDPNRPVRRLPPQMGSVGIKHIRKRWWSEASVAFAGPQKRLNGGDLGDERIGAERSRRDIASFFGGSRAQTDVVNGKFAPTGETLQQIQDRVLPIGSEINGVRVVDDSTRVPLFTKTPGFVTLNLVGGVHVSENFRLSFSLMNLLDRNYRVHGSGIDAAGFDAFVRWSILF
jgi:hemoglobin/transferrin/lactoferrin receptor protein